MTTHRILFSACLVAALTAATVAASVGPQAVAARPDVLTDGKRVYDANCANCHGPRAQGAVKAGNEISIIAERGGKLDHGLKVGARCPPKMLKDLHGAIRLLAVHFSKRSQRRLGFRRQSIQQIASCWTFRIGARHSVSVFHQMYVTLKFNPLRPLLRPILRHITGPISFPAARPPCLRVAPTIFRCAGK